MEKQSVIQKLQKKLKRRKKVVRQNIICISICIAILITAFVLLGIGIKINPSTEILIVNIFLISIMVVLAILLQPKERLKQINKGVTWSIVQYLYVIIKEKNMPITLNYSTLTKGTKLQVEVEVLSDECNNDDIEEYTKVLASELYAVGKDIPEISNILFR